MQHHSNRIALNCIHCNKQFSVPVSQTARGRSKFCGRSCYDNWRMRPEFTAERFWRRVNKNGPIPIHRPDLGPCWIWIGACGVGGYGKFSPPKRTVRAHRWSWELANGSVENGMCVLHHCDNPPCVRPTHLFLGTSADNVADKIAKGRMPVGREINTVKLTEDQVIEIRRRYGPGCGERILAAEYGVSPAAIYFAAVGKSWKHIPTSSPSVPE